MKHIHWAIYTWSSRFFRQSLAPTWWLEKTSEIIFQPIAVHQEDDPSNTFGRPSIFSIGKGWSAFELIGFSSFLVPKIFPSALLIKRPISHFDNVLFCFPEAIAAPATSAITRNQPFLWQPFRIALLLTVSIKMNNHATSQATCFARFGIPAQCGTCRTSRDKNGSRIEANFHSGFYLQNAILGFLDWDRSNSKSGLDGLVTQ